MDREKGLLGHVSRSMGETLQSLQYQQEVGLVHMILVFGDHLQLYYSFF